MYYNVWGNNKQMKGEDISKQSLWLLVFLYAKKNFVIYWTHNYSLGEIRKMPQSNQKISRIMEDNIAGGREIFLTRINHTGSSWRVVARLVFRPLFICGPCHDPCRPAVAAAVAADTQLTVTAMIANVKVAGKTWWSRIPDKTI